MNIYTAYRPAPSSPLGALVPTRRLGVAGRLGAGLSACLVVLAFGLPLWSVQLDGPGGGASVTAQAFITHLAVQASATGVGLAAEHHRLGLSAPPVGAYPGAWMMALTLGFAALCGFAAALGGRRPTLVSGLWALVAGVGGQLVIALLWLNAWGHSIDPQAAFKIAPFTPALVGIRQVGDVWVTSGFRAGALVLAAAATSAALALVLDRGRVQQAA